MKYMVG